MKKLTKKELEFLIFTLSTAKICGSRTPDFRSYCLGYYSGILLTMNLLKIDDKPPERLPEIEELTAMLTFIIKDFKDIQKDEAGFLERAEEIGKKMIKTASELYEEEFQKK